MKNMFLKRLARTFCLIMIVGIATHIILAERKVYWQDVSFSGFSTWVKQRFYLKNKASIAPPANIVRDTFRRVEKICKLSNPESELSKLNATASEKPFACSDDLWRMITYAQKMYQVTDGAFDITADPLLQLWTANRTPSAEELAKAKSRVGFDKLILDPAAKTVRFSVSGMKLDLNGIAKGVALDQARIALDGKAAVGTKLENEVPLMERLEAIFRNRRSPLNRGFIEVGGTALALSEPPPKQEKYAAMVPNPLKANGPFCGTVQILDEGISTVSAHNRVIADPVSGSPVTKTLSVSVVTKSAADACALAEAIFVRGPEFAEKMKKAYPDLRVLMFYRNPSEPNKVQSFSIGNWESVTAPVAAEFSDIGTSGNH